MKLFILIAFLISTASAFASNSEQEILRLQKGEYYYHYLTGDFPSAMNQIAQWRLGEDVVENEADVMEAAMLLSLGLHEKAQVIFQSIQEKDGVASSQSWFYLAKRWFELGNYSAVLFCVKNMSDKDISAEILAETQYMKTTSLIGMGEYKKAQKSILGMARDGIWTGFARHNYLLAMFNGNNSGQSLSILIEDAAFYLPETQEGEDLRDRINLISAMHYLQSGKNRSAEKHLKNISLDGPYTPAALLQYGWGKIEQGEYEAALQPWRELQVRYSRFDPEVMESMLGVPHVLELERAYTQALKVYEKTELHLLAMKKAVNKTSLDLPNNPWLDNWVWQQTDQSWGWMASVDKTLALNDTSAVMKGLLSENSFINQLTEYRDLVLLSNYLVEKEKSLNLWTDMVATRQQNSRVNSALPILLKAEKELEIAEVSYSSLQKTLDESGSSLLSLPSQKDNERNLLLARTANNIETLMQANKASRNVQQYQDRWQRVQGISLWTMNEEKPQKQWLVNKELFEMKQAIRKASVQLIETKLAKQWSPNSWIGMDDRINQLLRRTSQARKAAVEAKAQSKQELVSRSQQYLQQLNARINDYLSQARLSIARLYDDELQRQIAYGEIGGGDK